MGIYLPNMKMPEERESFTLTIKYNGLVFDTETGIQVAEAQEVPEHGRLIDGDAFLELCNAYAVTPSDDKFCKRLEYALTRAATLIPADKEEEE